MQGSTPVTLGKENLMANKEQKGKKEKKDKPKK
jgi:hypothetical protein